MPTILLTNDDGIQSIGLVTLKKQLEKLGNVIVVAPKGEKGNARINERLPRIVDSEAPFPLV